MQEVWDNAAEIMDLSNKKLWTPYVQVNKSLQYADNYNGQFLKSTFWLPGKPGGRPCVLHNRQGYEDLPCNAEHLFMCHIKRTYLHLRGLCKNSAIDNTYISFVKFNDLVWTGTNGTLIHYNSTNHAWEAKVIGSDVWATSEASYESLLLGTHDWIVYNDRQCSTQSFYKARLSMTVCSREEFNCNDGSCIPLEYWCDSNALDNSAACQDGSDELNCTVFHDLTGYVKEIIPLPNPYTELFFSAEIMNIQDISTFDGKFRVNFNLSMEWQDPRIKFQSIWVGKRVYNTIEKEEQDFLWKPHLVFTNLIHKDFEMILKPQIVVDCELTAKYTRPDVSFLYNNEIFEGQYCYLFWTTKMRYIFTVL